MVAQNPSAAQFSPPRDAYRAFPNLAEKRGTNKPDESSGLAGMLMPIYTAVIVLFFAYMLIKLLTRKGDDDLFDGSEDKKIYPNLKMDSEYRKYLLQEKYDHQGKSLESLRKKKLNAFIQNEGKLQFSGPNFEIFPPIFPLESHRKLTTLFFSPR